MREIIQIDETTRIRRSDPLNWTVEVLKDVEKKDGTKLTAWAGANGQRFGPYFGKIEHAFRWLLDYMTERDLPERVDMKGYMSAYERTAKKLIAVAKEVA